MRIFNIYHPNINYTYNWDASNYFGSNLQEEVSFKDKLIIELVFQHDINLKNPKTLSMLQSTYLLTTFIE